nr:protein degradation protein DER1 [Cryptomonas paramecium]
MIIDLLNSFPPITRSFLVISIVVNLLCFVGYIKPINIFLNYRLIIEFHNYWRFLSHIFFFGQIGLKTLFYIFFFIRYSKSLELFSFRNREEDYLHFLFTGSSIIFLLKIFVPYASFLGPSVTFMIIYIWGKKNAQQLINLIDILHIKGSSLPFLLMVSSYFMKQRTLKLDVLGMIAGHFCYYLGEIYPRLSGGRVPIGFFKKKKQFGKN